MVVEKFLEVEDSGVHPPCVKCEGCDGGVRVGLWRGGVGVGVRYKCGWVCLIGRWVGWRGGCGGWQLLGAWFVVRLGEVRKG